MTFTDADHAKAVELYGKFRTASWWPEGTEYRSGQWAIGTICGIPVLTIDPFHALSAIAWAMVERCDEWEYDTRSDGTRSYWARIGNRDGYGPTLFLALAAAVEGMDAAQ